MTKRPLKEWSTEELEERLESAASFPGAADMAEAKRILRERYAAPDRSLQRWIFAVAVATLVVSVVAWLIAIG
jgi:hypothetical protein